MIMEEYIEELVRSEGADYFGIADLSSAKKTIEEQGGKYLSSYPIAISIGITLLDSIIDQLPHGFEKRVAVSYRHHYDITNLRLDLIAARVASILSKKGYLAFPVPASRRSDDEKIAAVFSHKIAAHLAGLGWIGKSCMLITPESGPRVRWVTILTNAPLKITGKAIEDNCGNCRECIDMCPVGAFTGRPFQKDEKREMRFDAERCEQYLDDLEKTTGLATCGLCIYACPKR